MQGLTVVTLRCTQDQAELLEAISGTETELGLPYTALDHLQPHHPQHDLHQHGVGYGMERNPSGESLVIRYCCRKDFQDVIWT